MDGHADHNVQQLGWRQDGRMEQCMRIVVFGAGGGVGQEAVLHAVRRGHSVVAANRSRPSIVSPVLSASSPSPGAVRSMVVDVRDAEAVSAALVGADVVLWCVGVTTSSGPDVGRASLPGVLAAMHEHGLSRLVSISGAGITVAEDRKGWGARAVSRLTATLARDLVADKAGEHDLLAASDLDYTEVRAPRLSRSLGTGSYRLTTTAPGMTAKAVARADVASALVDLAADAGPWSRTSPFIVASRPGR